MSADSMGILFLVFVSMCIVTAYSNRRYARAHHKHMLSRVPEGEVAPPTHDVHMYAGNSFVFWTLIAGLGGMLWYYGVIGSVFDAVKNRIDTPAAGHSTVMGDVTSHIPFLGNSKGDRRDADRPERTGNRHYREHAASRPHSLRRHRAWEF